MKQMISPSALGDLPEHGLEPVLELAAVLGAGDHGAEVEGDQPLVLEPLGHVAAHDALGQPLDDGRLAHAGLADQHGVVLGAPRQHLHDAADFLVAADHRIELALPRQLGEVPRVALERLVLLLGILVGDALACRAPRPAPCRSPSAVTPCVPSTRAAAPALVLGDADQEVLGGDVLVLQALGFVPRPVTTPSRRGAAYWRPPPHTFGVRASSPSSWRMIVPPGAPELGEQRSDDAFLLPEQGQQQVLGLHGLVIALVGQRLGGLHRLLRFHGQLVESHHSSPGAAVSAPPTALCLSRLSGLGSESSTRTN